jgi:putative phosphoribosyl transferase
MKLSQTWAGTSHELEIPAGKAILHGNLCIPDGASALVLFVHGSGSSRHSPRNKYVANILNSYGLGTLLFDLLTSKEEGIDSYTGQMRFNIELLTERVEAATLWFDQYSDTAKLKLGYFGASSGAAAALVAASRLPQTVRAVVSRGGRPDLAGAALKQVIAPTLLIVGSKDQLVLDINREAYALLPPGTKKSLEIVPNASHLFEEPGTLECTAHLASDWFGKYFQNI